MFDKAPEVVAEPDEEYVYVQFNYESYKLDPEVAEQLGEDLQREAERATEQE